MGKDTRTPHQIVSEVAKAMEEEGRLRATAPAAQPRPAGSIAEYWDGVVRSFDLAAIGRDVSAISLFKRGGDTIKVERIEPMEFYTHPRARSAYEEMDAFMRGTGLRRPVWALAFNTPLFKASWERMCLLAFIDFAAERDYGRVAGLDVGRIWNAIAQHIPGAHGRSIASDAPTPPTQKAPLRRPRWGWDV